MGVKNVTLKNELSLFKSFNKIVRDSIRKP